MRRWALVLAIFVITLSMAILLPKFLAPPDIVEVRKRILPIGWQGVMVTDLDGDGNDEVIVETELTGLNALFAKQKGVVTAVTMRKGNFVTFPVPLTGQVRAPFPKGRRLVGRTEKGDFAVAELTVNGKWQIQVLLPKAKYRAFPYYDIGDLDGSGQDDDVVFLVENGNTRVLWFRRLPNGRWVKEKEIFLPAGRTYSPPHITSYGVEISVWTRTFSSDLPLLFWDGKWEIGQFDEQVRLFEGDLDGDGRSERILVRFLLGADKVRLKVQSKQVGRRIFEGTLEFKGWKVLNAAATDKFGDKRWHLLLVMAKDKPLMMRVVDCCFEPSKGWQVTELSRWEIQKTVPWSKPKMPDWVDLKVGDTDGDGRDEFVAGRWMLRRAGHQWVVQSLTTVQGQTVFEHFPWKEVNGRLWFFQDIVHWSVTPQGFHYERKPITALGTFDAQGQWQPVVQYHHLYFRLGKAGAWLEDLNDDRYPEVLALEGLIWLRPTLHYRSLEGQWRKANFAGGSLTRQLEVLLRGADVEPSPNGPLLVQWEGRK